MFVHRRMRRDARCQIHVIKNVTFHLLTAFIYNVKCCVLRRAASHRQQKQQKKKNVYDAAEKMSNLCQNKSHTQSRKLTKNY